MRGRKRRIRCCCCTARLSCPAGARAWTGSKEVHLRSSPRKGNFSQEARRTDPAPLAGDGLSADTPPAPPPRVLRRLAPPRALVFLAFHPRLLRTRVSPVGFPRPSPAASGPPQRTGRHTLLSAPGAPRLGAVHANAGMSSVSSVPGWVPGAAQRMHSSIGREPRPHRVSVRPPLLGDDRWTGPEASPARAPRTEGPWAPARQLPCTLAHAVANLIDALSAPPPSGCLSSLKLWAGTEWAQALAKEPQADHPPRRVTT